MDRPPPSGVSGLLLPAGLFAHKADGTADGDPGLALAMLMPSVVPGAGQPGNSCLSVSGIMVACMLQRMSATSELVDTTDIVNLVVTKLFQEAFDHL